MTSAPIPDDEEARLAGLRAAQILDSPAERSFDDIVKLAQLICDVPIALVSLVDADRQWFKARIGMAVAETPRDQSFCAHALAQRDALVIPDTSGDPRFVDNPLVESGPKIRSYAGVPIFLDEGGAAVGTLCVLDRVPRQLSGEQLAALAALARRVEMELRLRKHAITTQKDGQARALPRTGASGVASRTDDSKLEDGEIVGGRYKVESLIGVGGMGRVYRAVDTKSGGKRVALKVMGAMAVSAVEAVERFAREARALLRVESEHVARLLDAGNLDDGAPYLVMEHLEGNDLDHEAVPLGVERALVIALQACDGVAAVHDAGIVHRDLKPGNLFLARSGNATTLKLLDFGISKLSEAMDPANTPDPDGSLTQAAAVLGSPRYMSPEQLLSSRDVDTATDIWALGVIFYELLTGGHPFDGTGVAEICASVFTKKPRSMIELNAAIPASLDEVILRCVAREKADRWPTVRSLGQALAAHR